MSGSSCYKISKCLSVVNECNINSSTKTISILWHKFKWTKRKSWSVSTWHSLYNNVPLYKKQLLIALICCFLEDTKNHYLLNLLLSAVKTLLCLHMIAFTQVDGLAMDSPPAPQLANGWMSKFDDVIKGDATVALHKVYGWYK